MHPSTLATATVALALTDFMEESIALNVSSVEEMAAVTAITGSTLFDFMRYVLARADLSNGLVSREELLKIMILAVNDVQRNDQNLMITEYAHALRELSTTIEPQQDNQ